MSSMDRRNDYIDVHVEYENSTKADSKNSKPHPEIHLLVVKSSKMADDVLL